MDLDQTLAEVAAASPSIPTIPLEVHSNSVWADETCGEDCGENHLAHCGEFLDAQGWDDDLDDIGDPDGQDD